MPIIIAILVSIFWAAVVYPFTSLTVAGIVFIVSFGGILVGLGLADAGAAQDPNHMMNDEED